VRVIGLVGPSQLGKSYLASHLARHVWRDGDRIYRRDCRDNPPVDLIISDMVCHVRPDLRQKLGQYTYDDQTSLILRACAHRRNLFILDNIDPLIDIIGDLVSDDYKRLFERFCDEDHVGVLMFTSQIGPRLLNSRVAYFEPAIPRLTGVSARAVLRRAGLVGTDRQMDDIAVRLAGLPGYLWIVARGAVDRGLDAARLLATEDLLRPAGRDILAEELGRLADTPAGQLLAGLSVFRRPVPFEALQYALGSEGSPAAEDVVNRALNHAVALGLMQVEVGT
jgi:hypothetical protein